MAPVRLSPLHLLKEEKAFKAMFTSILYKDNVSKLLDYNLYSLFCLKFHAFNFSYLVFLKAYYRRASAYMALGKFKLSLKDYEIVGTFPFQ